LRPHHVPAPRRIRRRGGLSGPGERDGNLDDDRADRQEPDFALGLPIHIFPAGGLILIYFCVRNRTYAIALLSSSIRARQLSVTKSGVGCSVLITFGCTMSKSKQLLRDELDCLRLASDLTQLASYVPSFALKAHILQLARRCTVLVDQPETKH
jgi:hypothetical protein